MTRIKPSDTLHRVILHIDIMEGGRKDDRISVGNYIKIKIDKKIMIAQVLGFKFLSGKHEECPMNSCPIIAPKEFSKRGIGLLVNVFAINKLGKMEFLEAPKNSQKQH